jgi:phage tail-like protein
MAQFSVIAKRFRPYKNFKFHMKCDGRSVAGISKFGALKLTTEVMVRRESGDLSTGSKSPGRTRYEAITLERGVTHDKGVEQWAIKEAKRLSTAARKTLKRLLTKEQHDR